MPLARSFEGHLPDVVAYLMDEFGRESQALLCGVTQESGITTPRILPALFRLVPSLGGCIGMRRCCVAEQ